MRKNRPVPRAALDFHHRHITLPLPCTLARHHFKLFLSSSYLSEQRLPHLPSHAPFWHLVSMRCTTLSKQILVIIYRGTCLKCLRHIYILLLASLHFEELVAMEPECQAHKLWDQRSTPSKVGIFLFNLLEVTSKTIAWTRRRNGPANGLNSSREEGPYSSSQEKFSI